MFGGGTGTFGDTGMLGGTGVLGEDENARGNWGSRCPPLPPAPVCCDSVCLYGSVFTHSIPRETPTVVLRGKRGKIPPVSGRRSWSPPALELSPALGGRCWALPDTGGVAGLGHSGCFPPARGSREPQEVPVGMGTEPSAQWVLYSPRPEPGCPHWERKRLSNIKRFPRVPGRRGGHMNREIKRLCGAGSLSGGSLVTPQSPPELPRAGTVPSPAFPGIPASSGMDTARAEQRHPKGSAAKPRLGCPEGEEGGMKVLSGRTKMLLEALDCWRWDVGEKRREQMFPRDIVSVQSSGIWMGAINKLF